MMLRGFYQYFGLHHCERKLSWVRHEVQRQWIARPESPGSTTPAELDAPERSLVVRTAVCSQPAPDGLTRCALCQCHLGSPVREICTPGSAWGDEFKRPCLLGEGTGAKAQTTARLRKGLPLQGSSLPS